MHGTVFQILENFVLEKHGGEDAWHAIKKKANCTVPDGGFLSRSYYEDSELIDLVVAASELLGAPVNDVIALFGHYFGYFIIHRNGSSAMLECQGTSLRSWLSNLNAMHDHIQMSYPGGSSQESKFLAPVFWCEDCDEFNDSIILHYYSSRGAVFVPFVPGVVKEISQWRFDMDIQMELLNTQGETKGTDFTSWRIKAVNASDTWKLKGHKPDHLEQHCSQQHPKRQSKRSSVSAKCPFTGLQRTIPINQENELQQLFELSDDDEEHKDDTGSQQLTKKGHNNHDDDMGMTVAQMEAIFPFHILLDQNFSILSVGNSLPTILGKGKQDLMGSHVKEFLEISRPVLEDWNWPALHKLADQSFFLVPSWSLDSSIASVGAEAPLEFKGSLLPVGTKDAVLLALAPNIRNVQELKSAGLCLTDLPLHGCQRDTIYLGEYITQEVERAQELDLLSRSLELEKNTSNALLHNMLPAQVADQLRQGGVVEPKHYENVTLFFSDVVGFTSICDRVDPWDVIDMLNQLYSVMDHLAEKFKLYKVETIGDAYMCCSGLPHADPHHAENIANFALAVQQCIHLVKSPVDGTTPLELRIGIHTGECTAGVVGTMTPHYCLFGDMVNVSARHEQTGLAGKIQSSSELYGRLHHDSPFPDKQFTFAPRGLIDMKGKATRFTYWLEGGTEHNQHVNPEAMEGLKEEVGKILYSKTWKMRKYFSRTSGALRYGNDDASLISAATGSTEPLSEYKAKTEDGAETDNQARQGRSNSEDTVPFDNSNHPLGGVRREDDASDNDVADNGSVDPMDMDATQRDLNLDDFSINANESSLHHNITNSHRVSFRDDCSITDLVFLEYKREDLVQKVYDILLPLLKLCMLDHDCGSPTADTELLTQQLRKFLDAISSEFKRHPYHNFRRTAHVVAWSNRLFERLQDSDAGLSGLVDTSPWYRLALTMAALLRHCKHLGVTDEQLAKEGDIVFQMHGRGCGGNSNCQAKYSLAFGLDLMEEEFPALFGELRWGCPTFLYLLRKAALVGDPKADFERSMRLPIGMPQHMAQRTEATMALVMKMTDLGYFALQHDNFKRWMDALFAQRRLASLAGRGENPVETWDEDCIGLFNEEVLPLVRLCHTSFPGTGGLEARVVANRTAFEAERDDMVQKGLFPRRRQSETNLRRQSDTNLLKLQSVKKTLLKRSTTLANP